MGRTLPSRARGTDRRFHLAPPCAGPDGDVLRRSLRRDGRGERGPPFAVDVLRCPSCQGRMRLLAVIKEPASIARTLAAVGEASEVPRRSPGRGVLEEPGAPPAGARRRAGLRQPRRRDRRGGLAALAVPQGPRGAVVCALDGTAGRNRWTEPARGDRPGQGRHSVAGLDRAWQTLRKATRARTPGCGLTREPPSYYLRSAA